MHPSSGQCIYFCIMHLLRRKIGASGKAESLAELYALDSAKRKDRLGNGTLYRIEPRFSQSCRKAGNYGLDCSAHGITVSSCLTNHVHEIIFPFRTEQWKIHA